jgi:cysteinyl-tRNA synthetase
MRQYKKKLQTQNLLQVMTEEYRSLQLNLHLLNHQFQPRASNLISMVIEAARVLQKAKAKYSHTLIMVSLDCAIYTNTPT